MKAQWTKILVCWVCVMGLQLGAAALEVAPELPGASVAQAQIKFKGKIKNVRIKKTRAGSSFKLVSRASGDSPDALGALHTEASLALGDEQLPVEVTPGLRRNSAQVVASSPGVVIPEGASVTLTLSLNEDDFDWDSLETDGYTPAERITLTSVGSTSTVGLGENGWKVSARRSPQGALKVVVSHQSSAWSGEGLASLTYQVEGHDDLSGQLTIHEYRQAWVQDLQGELALLERADAVTLHTTLLDSEGGVVATRSDTSSLQEGSVDPGFDRIRLGETRRGDARLTAITAGQDNIAALEVEVTDLETGEVALSALDQAPVGTAEVFTQSLEFDPGDSPAGSVYRMLLEGLNPEGAPIGEQYEADLPVFGPECTPQSCPEAAWIPFAQGQGRAAVIQNGEAFELWVITSGELEGFDAFAGVFEEPFEGPTPLETEVVMPRLAQFNQWTTCGGAGLPASYSFQAQALNEDGQVLDEVQGSGAGAGNVYSTAGNGKGTRKGLHPSIIVIMIPLL